MKYFKKDKLLTTVINTVLFWTYPIVTHSVFTVIVKTMQEQFGQKVFKNVFPLLFQTITVISIAIFYITCYYFDFAFLERFKITDIDWPWKSNPKGWQTLKKKLISRYLFNYIVIAPIFAKLVYTTSNTDYSSNLPSLYNNKV